LNVTVKARFEIAALLVSAIGIFVIVSGLIKPTGGSEPGRLPSCVRAARPAGSVSGELLDQPASEPTRTEPIGRIDGEIRTASHNAMISTVVAAAALGQMNPITNVTLAFQDVDNNPKSQSVTHGQVISGRPRDRITITGTMPQPAFQQDDVVVVSIDGRHRYSVSPGPHPFSIEIPKLADGVHGIRIVAVRPDGHEREGIAEFQFTLRIRTKPVQVLDVDSSALSFSTGPYLLKVTFDTPELDFKADMFSLSRLTDTGATEAKVTIKDVTQMGNTGSVEILIEQALQAGLYELQITGGEKGLKDKYGNLLQGTASLQDFQQKVLKPIGAEVPSVAPGITGATGPYVPFQEFTQPRNVPDGFNPHDKVETRVVRLYYFRDAHRVAQIINRKVRSYNRAGVDMQRQLADKARTEADQRTVARQQAERYAIVQAQKTRQVEQELQGAELALQRSVQELTNYRRSNPDAKPEEDDTIKRLASLVQSFERRVRDARAQVDALRSEEVRANEEAQRAEAQERLSREEQFRREVAAAHADPDTYAPGVPKSDDPVEQVSVSVIGEGLIHLRGPLKGINTIRTMIDQIDQPVGQVRVAVHTVQINGEKQARMEDVSNIIQMYLDHSRFLTMQSSEMLRKAVVQVASRKAEEAIGLYPGESQRDRDRRYLDAFFGREFIDELEAMDSEFLRSGNKILSLHSMDTTSLSSALNLLALAKNSTRLEILSEFEQMTQGELPAAEAIYMEAAMTVCQQKWSMRHPPKFYPMAQRAVFQSLKGFFDAQIAHDDTLTPLQREFIRLAQIFKSRLITELEYKQRVMERGMIEELGGDRLGELDEARRREETATRELDNARSALRQQRQQVLGAITKLAAFYDRFNRTFETFQSMYAEYDALAVPSTTRNSSTC
jgi:hypothetical protein